MSDRSAQNIAGYTWQQKQSFGTVNNAVENSRGGIGMIGAAMMMGGGMNGNPGMGSAMMTPNGNVCSRCGSAVPAGTEFWNLSLADLGSLFKGEEEKPNTGKIIIDFENDTQRTVLTDDNGTQSLINSYSVASRVLVSDLIDMEKMENHFLIISASLGSQILKTYSLKKSNGEKGPELNVKDISSFLFDVLNGKIQIKEIDGKVSFDELKKNFD